MCHGPSAIPSIPTVPIQLQSSNSLWSLGVYDDNIRCKWVIRRPMFGSVVLKLKELDMEEHITCLYDYLVISAMDYTSFGALK